jgi:hypothetical protein
MKGEGAQ